MTKKIYWMLVLIIMISMFSMVSSGILLAEEGQADQVSVTVMPVKYTAVKGDVEKYRLHHWLKDGYTGGFKDVSFDHKFSKDTSMSFEGHTIPAENDNEADFILKKNNFGYLKTEYNSFRKYFDGTGGLYYPFTSLRVNELDRDLALDIGHLLIEIGSDPEDKSNFSFAYEHHTKDGSKSRLAWTAVKVGTLTHNIGPSWQDIDESHDVLSLKGKTEAGGFDIKGEQRWEFVHETSLREEKLLATTGVAADTKMRRQDQELKSDIMSTTLHGERWFQDDNTFLGLGYRYNQINNDELEFLKEYTAAGVPASYGAPKNKFNAMAENKLDQHIWTGNYSVLPMTDLNFISKFKAEIIGAHGNSVYPSDITDPPDGISNTTDISDTQSKVYRFGENLGVRYSGISHTSLFSELELEQTRNLLYENRDSKFGQSNPDTAEIIGRETLTHIGKAIWSLGARVVPSREWNVTTQIKHRLEDNDYDDRLETVSATGAKSAFFDDLRINSDEVSTKVQVKPTHWLQTAVRYQYQDTKYLPRVEDQDRTKNQQLAHIFSYDVLLQPIDPLMLTLSYTKQLSKTTTPAGRSTSTRIPGFTSNYDSWLLSASYTPKESLSFINTIQLSTADNFDDFDSYLIGLPLGADYLMYDITSGFQWSPKRNLTIEPKYIYSHYDASTQSADLSKYNAHTIWLDLTLHW